MQEPQTLEQLDVNERAPNTQRDGVFGRADDEALSALLIPKAAYVQLMQNRKDYIDEVTAKGLLTARAAKDTEDAKLKEQWEQEQSVLTNKLERLMPFVSIFANDPVFLQDTLKKISDLEFDITLVGVRLEMFATAAKEPAINPLDHHIALQVEVMQTASPMYYFSQTDGRYYIARYSKLTDYATKVFVIVGRNTRLISLADVNYYEKGTVDLFPTRK